MNLFKNPYTNSKLIRNLTQKFKNNLKIKLNSIKNSQTLKNN